jgi:S-methylmethionine-dependent homocysteine/selenocysteine methylase
VCFEKIFKDEQIILTEGALVERLKCEFGLRMDEHVNHAGLVYDARGDVVSLYRQYVEIARRHDLPIMLMTPTRRVNFESLGRSAYRDRDVIADSCALLQGVREGCRDFSKRIFIGGLLGCKGDAYSAAGALSRSDAYAFHAVQVSQFAGRALDFLFAGIMPALSEAQGMAQAMAESELPYIISFMVRSDGRLLDGTGIADAMRCIDETVAPRPLCYMCNCVHPANLKRALDSAVNRGSSYLGRFMGIQGNASPLGPEELEGCGTPEAGDLDEWVQAMADLQRDHGFKIFGGCCGTDDRFIEQLARTLKQSLPR